MTPLTDAVQMERKETLVSNSEGFMMGNKDEQVWKHSETGVCAVLVSSDVKQQRRPQNFRFPCHHSK